ncbi:hypothetical protein [Alkalicoccus urumqiensis]|uniref:Uncharacterized protein n=1 Tax=Alkalicoccus urumqiensis TaxID=1548213 RepID=A0A2P6MGC3_ALKUR|nr:hypothetical protein [Alkalicoccus urumqiensis]PRO65317.1 hypothetical protein C6I21_10985 [Alkalicoccus urumqiensis]
MTSFLTDKRLKEAVLRTRGDSGEKTYSRIAGNIYDVEEGSLYLPKRRSGYDGHQFIEAAVESGASAALWAEDEPLPDTIPDSFPLYITEDPEAVLKKLAEEFMAGHTAEVIQVKGDYAADVFLKTLETWMHANVQFLTGPLQAGVTMEERLLSIPDDVHTVFLRENQGERDHRAAGPDKVITISAHPSKEDAGSESVITPATPTRWEKEIPSWLDGFFYSVGTAADFWKKQTGSSGSPPWELLKPEQYGFQSMNSSKGGVVLLEAVALRQQTLDYTIGVLSDIGSFERRALVIDEGFQADRRAKTIHETVAEKLPEAITDVICIGEKAFWVHDQLRRMHPDTPVSSCYQTHSDALGHLKELLSTSAVLLYKGANREMIYEILQELNRN